jgi:hypothetical protein
MPQPNAGWSLGDTSRGADFPAPLEKVGGLGAAGVSGTDRVRLIQESQVLAVQDVIAILQQAKKG